MNGLYRPVGAWLEGGYLWPSGCCRCRCRCRALPHIDETWFSVNSLTYWSIKVSIRKSENKRIRQLCLVDQTVVKPVIVWQKFSSTIAICLTSPNRSPIAMGPSWGRSGVVLRSCWSNVDWNMIKNWWELIDNCCLFWKMWWNGSNLVDKW